MLKTLCVIALALVAGGCCQTRKDDSDDKPIPITTSPGTEKATTTPVQTAAPPAATPAQAAGGYSPDGLPTDIPASRSAVPTLAEWNAVPREINVGRSTPLNCETKMVREWLRVSCRPKSKTGGTPTGVKHKSGPEQDSYYFAKGGVASLVTPVLRGKHQESTFSWTDKVQTLVIDWPHGAPRPTINFTD